MNIYNESQVLSFVDDLYETSVNGQSWSKTIKSFADLVGGMGGNLMLWDKNTGKLPLCYTAGFSTEAMKVYSEKWVVEDPRAAYLKKNSQISIYYDGQYITEEEKRKNVYYNEWEHKYTEQRYCVGMRLIRDMQHEMVFSLAFNSVDPDQVKAAKLLYERLGGHLKRAVQIHQLFGGFLADKQAKSAVFDRLPYGVIFLDRLGRIGYYNKTAEDFNRRSDSVSFTQKGINIGYIKLQRRYEALVTGCNKSDSDKDLPGGWLSIPRAGHLRPYSLFVAPIPLLENASLFTHPSVLVLISDPDRDQRATIGRFASCHNLTLSEDSLCQELVSGLSLNEIAQKQNVSINTIRFHLKNIFSKTGVSRQTDLIREILSLPVC